MSGFTEWAHPYLVPLVLASWSFYALLKKWSERR